MLDNAMRKMIRTAQRNEITEHFVYEKLAKSLKDPHKAGILRRISRDELRHYGIWKKQSGEDVKPNKLKYATHLPMSPMLRGVVSGSVLCVASERPYY
ncbi:MAG: hypothetical protein ABIK79_16485 [Chloroflexota bacterium]